MKEGNDEGKCDVGVGFQGNLFFNANFFPPTVCKQQVYRTNQEYYWIRLFVKGD